MTILWQNLSVWRKLDLALLLTVTATFARLTPVLPGEISWVLGTLGVYLLSRRFGVSFLALLDLCALALFAVLIVFNLAAFLSGALLGAPTDLPWGVHPFLGLGFFHPLGLYKGSVLLLLLLAGKIFNWSREGSRALLLFLGLAVFDLLEWRYGLQESLWPLAMGFLKVSFFLFFLFGWARFARLFSHEK